MTEWWIANEKRRRMTGKAKVKFIAAIWGERYIEEFAHCSLPSYLSRGNLPSLAQDFDLEILIMTTAESRLSFEREAAFGVLKSICPIRFIYIDDLITTGIYGVTLTLAYARAVMDSGAAQVDTCFIFMNSDFVLADGALKALAERLRRGERCVMAPSLRARAETVLPTLLQEVDTQRHTLTMRPREMVRLAFANLHPTVIAKTISQTFIRSSTYNQIYWQVNDSTLLGRYHLIFMLAIRPEVPMPPVSSYCDYGFVPELVPSGSFSVLADSDEFFMLELQPTDQEKHFLRCGRPSVGDIAAELSRWTTREHRRFAEIDVLFHAKALPDDIDRHRAEAGRFVEALGREMSAIPMDHARHHYWVLGVQTWSMLRASHSANGKQTDLPPELALPGSTSDEMPEERVTDRQVSILKLIAGNPYLALMRTVRQQTGRMPNVAIWHHLWLDSRLVWSWARSTASGQSLLIYPDTSQLPTPLSAELPLETLSFRELLDSRRKPNAAYDRILIHVWRKDIRQTAELVEAAAELLRPSGTLSLFFEHMNSELDPSNFSHEMAQYIEQILPSHWIRYTISAAFSGGRVKRRLRLLDRAIKQNLLPGRILDVPACALAVVGWPIVAALTAVNNIRLRNSSDECLEYCSSALVSLRLRSSASESFEIVDDEGRRPDAARQIAVDTV